MRTFLERKEATLDMIFDPDLDLSPTEVLAYLYHWFKYERAVTKRNKARRAMREHGIWLNENKTIYAARKTLNDL